MRHFPTNITVAFGVRRFYTTESSIHRAFSPGCLVSFVFKRILNQLCAMFSEQHRGQRQSRTRSLPQEKLVGTAGDSQLTWA